MICFDVRVNGDKVCTAGIGKFGVMSAMVNWVRRHPRPELKLPRTKQLELNVGGFCRQSSTGDGEHLRWLARALKVGDKVTISVLDKDTYDEPKRREPYIARVEEQHEREYYERLKKKYGDLAPNSAQRAEPLRADAKGARRGQRPTKKRRR